MDNGKKEFAKSGTEEEVISSRARRIYCYLANGNGVAKKVKRVLNKRFRKRAKLDILKQQEEDMMTADEMYIEDILNKFK